MRPTAPATAMRWTRKWASWSASSIALRKPLNSTAPNCSTAALARSSSRWAPMPTRPSSRPRPICAPACMATTKTRRPMAPAPRPTWAPMPPGGATVSARGHWPSAARSARPASASRRTTRPRPWPTPSTRKTADTGVTASARTEVQLSFSAPGAYTFQLRSENRPNPPALGQPMAFHVTATGTLDGLSNAIAAINEQSAKTGVTAALNPGATGIVLTNTTGQDIGLYKSASDSGNAGTITVQKQNADGLPAGSAGALAAAAGVGNATVSGDVGAAGGVGNASVRGYVVLDANKPFSTTVTTTNAFNTTAPADSASSLQEVAGLDVTTFKNATEALKTVDSALSFINGERAKLGALQSRFESTIASLNITSENLSASRSRILDADFATETANLSRAQILQQAGTAMVAQANQIPQGVLKLLQ